jgi:hypothetical protein
MDWIMMIAWGGGMAFLMALLWWALDMTVNWEKHLLHVPGPWPMPLLGKNKIKKIDKIH